MIYNHFMFNRHSLLLEKNQCNPLEIQANERKANLSYTTRLPYSKPQERYLKKKRELGRETEIRSMSTINKSLMCSSSVILAVKCPILLLSRKKVGKLFPGDQESKHFWLCGKQAFVPVLPKQHKSSHRQQLLQLALLVTTTQLGRQKSLRHCRLVHGGISSDVNWWRTQLVLSAGALLEGQHP